MAKKLPAGDRAGAGQPSETPEARRARLVDAAIADGRLSAKNRQRWLDYLKEDPGTYEPTLASLVAVPELREWRGAAARSMPSQPRAAVGASPSGGRFPHPRPDEVSTWAQGSDGSARVSAARARGGEPTLFTGGQLPPFTASGIPPEALLEVPWKARHALAAAPSTAAAYAFIDRFRLLSQEDAEVYAAAWHGNDSGNRQYAMAVETWLLDGLTSAEVLARLSAESAAEVQERFRSSQAQRGYTV
jgi:hypothetical protein